MLPATTSMNPHRRIPFSVSMFILAAEEAREERWLEIEQENSQQLEVEGRCPWHCAEFASAFGTVCFGAFALSVALWALLLAWAFYVRFKRGHY